MGPDGDGASGPADVLRSRCSLDLLRQVAPAPATPFVTPSQPGPAPVRTAIGTAVLRG